MRFFEFASAEEQVALFKLVSDSVWQALATQQKQQADQAAAKQVAAKKSKGLRSKLKLPKPMPLPAKAPQPKTTHPSQPQPVQSKSVLISPVSTQKDAVTSAALANRQVGRQA